MTIERAFASAVDVLDQTSYTQIDSMTLTPPAGDYLAVFSMQCQLDPSPSDGQNLSVAIYVDGVQQAHSVRSISENSSLPDMYCGITTSAYVSPAGSEVVEVRYIASSGTGPIDGYKRELNLFPAPGTNFQDTDVVTDTIATASWTTLDSMTRTPAANDYLLLFTCSCECVTAGESLGFRLSVGGTPVAHTERQSELESSANPSIYTVMLAAKISPGGSDVVEIEWARISGTGTNSCYERNMILIEIPSADIFEASGVVDDTDSTSGSDVAIDDLLIENPGAADYLILFSSFDFYGSLSAPQGVTTYKIYEGGAEDTNLTRIFEHEDSLDSTDMPFYLTGRVTLGDAADDIQAYWNANSTVQRIIYERTLIAIREPTATYKLEGFTKNNDGGVEVSCKCFLVKDNGDNTFTEIAYQLSNGVTGAYSFTGILDNDPAYQVISWKDGSPNIFDVTDHVLTPVIE